jgi:hypothetical protein
MSTCGGQFLKEGSRKRRDMKKRTCLKNGRRQHKKNKKLTKKEHKRRTCSGVDKKSVATNNDYTDSCIQPTNQKRCLRKKKSEKSFPR